MMEEKEEKGESSTYAYEKPDNTSELDDKLSVEEFDNTYPYESNEKQTIKEILKTTRQKLKALKIKAEKDKRYRIAKVKERRIIRDDKLDRIKLKLKTMKSYMAEFNLMGKKKQDKYDILGTISKLINNDIVLAEDIERSSGEKVEEPEKLISTSGIITKEMVEAVDESEISPPGR